MMELAIEYHPEEFWTERFRKYGHTGYKDPLYYAYSQPLRIKAVRKALQRLNLMIDAGWQVLDVGCGSGDFVEEFARMGAHVTGADISKSLVNWTKRRFSDQSNVKIEVDKAEHLNFSKNSFDLVMSITVLQHIVDSICFENAVRNIIHVTKYGGYILIFETSPGKNYKAHSLPYIYVRGRDEWIKFFETKGCRLVFEMPFPELGIRFLESFDVLLNLLRKRLGEHSTYLVKRFILHLLKPLDHIFISLPFPREASAMRILIFRKS